MDDKNKVLLEGVVCSEPTIKETEKSRVLNFRIATQEEGRKWPDRNNVSAWGDVIIPLQEGDRVEVRGKMETRSYEKGGERRYFTACNASKITRLSSANPVDDDDDLPF